MGIKRVSAFFNIVLFCFLAKAQQPIIPKFSDRMLEKPNLYTSELEAIFKVSETKKVFTRNLKDMVVLENGYAQHNIKNIKDWLMLKEEYQAHTIDVVYTKYPKDREFWLTDYHELLVKRLKELFKFDSALNDVNIKFNIILQTSCETQDEAKAMFHGFIIRYAKRKAKPSPKPDAGMTPVQRVDRYLVEVGGLQDSFVWRTLAEHPSWKNALVVMDMTGSMYQYSPQVLLWHLKNTATSGIKYLCYFNDGDKKQEKDKLIGVTGGIYFIEAAKAEKASRMLYTVMRAGYGGETLDENDCEALIEAQKHFEGFDELILVADNTPIRDYELLSKIKHPVRVILTGCEWGINVEYINLAYRTGGSVYTISDDINDILSKAQDGVLSIGQNKYKLNSKSNLFECLDQESCDYQFKKEVEAEQGNIAALRRSPVGRKMAKPIKGQKLTGKKVKKKGFFKRLFGG
ncbi:MAG: hypothetical protein SGJ10_06895 [Bacteroidota bacterium]|nr:hypothetical protein [Bacteroidota bacterium]